MRALIYDLSSVVLAAVLLISMVLAIELGYRIGRRRAAVKTTTWTSDHINTVQGAMLGFLSLLLGFTFSLLAQRFDLRVAAVVEEANAIGTTYMRAGLLPPAVRDEAKASLRRYVDLRVEMGALEASRTSQEKEVKRQHDALWRLGERAAQMERDDITALFIEAVNEMIASYERQDALLRRHLPGVGVLLLYAAFFASGVTMGYGSGVAGRRPSMFDYLMVSLVIGLIYVIGDLDRPGRGLIPVSQKSLVDLQASMTRGLPDEVERQRVPPQPRPPKSGSGE